MSSNPLTGIVLCGGQSVRMGKDKAFITYHNLPQYAYVSRMLQQVCDNVVVSCNNNQKNTIPSEYTTIEDNATFIGNGPISGLLSVHNQIPEQAFMLCACDYPYFTQQDMMTLVQARSISYDAVCYLNPETGYAEPLLAIYEVSAIKKLLPYFQSGQSSLLHFLKSISTHFITGNALSLKSIDNPSGKNE